MAGAARREGEKGEVREPAARENQELRNLLEAARLEPCEPLENNMSRAQAIRSQDQRKMAVAWDQMIGQADEQMKTNMLLPLVQ
eukprot:8830301-Pyramimonas_sp.AAC.1